MSTLPVRTSILRRRSFLRRLIVMTPVLDSISAVLLPALIALIASAFIVGHGHISAGSIAEVFDMMGQTDTMPSP